MHPLFQLNDSVKIRFLVVFNYKINTNIFHDMHNKLLTLHVVRALIDRLYVCLQSDPEYLYPRETSVLQVKGYKT